MNIEMITKSRCVCVQSSRRRFGIYLERVLSDPASLSSLVTLGLRVPKVFREMLGLLLRIKYNSSRVIILFINETALTWIEKTRRDGKFTVMKPMIRKEKYSTRLKYIGCIIYHKW